MHWGIRQRILTLSLLPTLFVALLLTLHWVGIKILELDKQLLDRGETLVAFLGPAAEYGVISGNQAYLEAITAKARAQPDMIGILIQDYDGTLIYEYQGTADAVEVPRWQRWMARQLFTERIVHFRRDIHLSALDPRHLSLMKEEEIIWQDERPIGSVQITLSNLPISLQQVQWIMQSLGLTVLVIIGLFLLIPHLSLSLSRPLEKIAATVKQIDQGDLAARSRARVGGEIGGLQKGINSMADSIERSHQVMLEQIHAATVSLRDQLTLINTKNRELLQAQEQADLINQRKTRFLASISHELRTPLSAIKGYAELLSQQGNLDEQERSWITTIEAVSRDSLQLVNDLLDISHIEAGTVAIHHTRFDLRPLVLEVISLCRRGVAGDRNVDISLLMNPATPVWISSDPLRIKQLLTNVVTNAVKFTRNGHVIVRVGPHPDRSGMLALSVEDFGAGIEAEYLERIFEPFYQIHREAQPVHIGSGLGLSIARGLISILNGELTVDSEPGEGCIFHLHIPIHVVSPPPDDSDPEKWQAPMALLTDDAEVCFIAQGCLQRLGLHTQCQIEVDDFLQMLEDHPKSPGLIWLRQPPPVLLDVLMNRQTLASRVILTAFNTLDIFQQTQLRRQGVLLIPPYLTVDMLQDHLRRQLRTTPEMVPEPPKSPSPQNQTLSGIRVLVADDNATNRRLLCEFVHHCGAQADEAEHGEQALRRYLVTRHDLIFMDMHMPVMDGLQALKAIRREAPGVKIVAVTADAQENTHNTLMASGFDHVLIKPASQADVMACLTRFPKDIATVSPVSTTGEKARHDPAQALRMAGGSPALARELATLLLRDLQQARRDLDDPAIKQTVLVKLAHQLKGASRYCATARLEAAASALENALRDGEDATIPTLRQALLQEVDALLALEAQMLNL
ncbi:two-component system, NarL family, sensor histidine kinase BarA [Ectothiorhodospira magna]|uniref:histidine kinase n=1 Tax=Ectothiorhodospira magna TaxID=867345 RepID=A0A1H9CF91_9GAMM|nr:ATP-binding protein [Ectothiorhodospira magna]SEP99318.1 two-component system, NarL family, sensor histidine kinase BarA [Ectothiorhodospira magna]